MTPGLTEVDLPAVAWRTFFQKLRELLYSSLLFAGKASNQIDEILTVHFSP
jgi:hypothetical protein